MIDFLYKSSVSLLVFLVVYHLILERQKMHRFNRFYLLFCLVFSFVLPFITIEIAVKNTPVFPQIYTSLAQTISDQNTVVYVHSYNYRFLFLWCFYVLITLILMFRFSRNILNIISKIKTNNIVVYKNSCLVLLKEETAPHTFLNYIFLNEIDYKNRKIEEELYCHELIHVTQKHTLDVLLIEILKTLFWFNPVFVFYKKAIQLNHEFLADEDVVTCFNNVPFYQNLLISHTNTNSISGLTSNLNYSITKKRFIMMTKTVSKTKILLSKIMLMPLILGFTFFMSIESVGQINTADSSKQIAANSVQNNNVDKSKNAKPNFFALEMSKTVTGKAAGFFCIPGTNPLENVTVKPEFQGGKEKLYKYISENFKTPKDCVNGAFNIGFVVEKDGSLSNFTPVNEGCQGKNDEAARVLKDTKWNPGEIDGKAVRTSYLLEIPISAAKK